MGTSRTITIHPTVSEDFFDYGKLFDLFYKPLTGQIKQNHIFTSTNGHQMEIRESVMHQEFIFTIGKKWFEDIPYLEMIERVEEEFKPLEWEGINPYKAYELFKNFRPYVPVECQSDPMYTEPSPEVLAEVRAEKVDRRVIRVALKKKKYERTKKQLEDVAFGDGDGADGDGAKDGAFF